MREIVALGLGALLQDFYYLITRLLRLFAMLRAYPWETSDNWMSLDYVSEMI